MPKHTRKERAKNIARAVASAIGGGAKRAAKATVNVAGKGIIGGVKILNRGLEAQANLAKGIREEGKAKRKAKKKVKVDARQAKIDAIQAARNKAFKEGGKTLFFKITRK